MPRGIYNRKSTVKKKQTIEVKPEPTIKANIIHTLTKRHIEFTDMDGHIAINTAQMVDASALLDLLADGVQAINTRKSKNGDYIALYY